MLGYLEDGPNVVTLAMNGWGEAEPAWWLNLRAHPGAAIELGDGPRAVTRTRRGGRRTIAPLGQVAGGRQEPRRVRGAPLIGDRGRRPRAAYDRRLGDRFEHRLGRASAPPGAV